MEQIHDLQLNHLKIIQDDDKFMFGTDGVLLARFAKVKKGERALDIGSGTGIVSFIGFGLQSQAHYTGIDIQADMTDMAQRSQELNGIEPMEFVTADLKGYDGRHGFDVVTCNPPYEKLGAGEQTQNPYAQIARYEIAAELPDIVACAFRALQPAGRLYMIHRAHRLTQVARVLREHQLELKGIRPILKDARSAPKLLLLEASYGGKEYLHWYPPVILYGEDRKMRDYEEMGL